jgi:alpha-amylase/alpha-mannosidase (GH57 family)
MTIDSLGTTDPSALNVCILWHMHQPDYRDPISGQTLLPWTWLHGLKDYAEMLETIAETRARVTVNLVPSLIEQLERYANGSDRDSWLELLTRYPDSFTAIERRFVVEHFFSVNIETQVQVNPRYRQLYAQRGSLSDQDVERFSAQDLLDLQVLFLLAWTGSHMRRKNPLVRELIRQRHSFTQVQKLELLDSCHVEISRVLDFHRKLEGEGLIEISVTPYAHPILPLLCDLRTAHEPSPKLAIPTVDFRFPDDARLQVREGLKTAQRIFGERARGMWPAEGAVSEAAAILLKEEGAQWAATDEDILARSLGGGLVPRNRLYQIYQYQGLPLLFRDRELSDRIGFLYANWKTEDALKDLHQCLRSIAADAPGGTVSIILDGENCWERYPDNGYPFLRELYQTIHADPKLEMTTVSQALAGSQPVPLTRLAAGSWIRSDFTTWIGHPEENLAWELLYQARTDCISNEIAEALVHPQEPLSDLVRELLRAEGSDWFWWYGDEHMTAQADIFDRLFRLHLEGLYHLKGLPVPTRLQQAIKPVHKESTGFEPTASFTPHIDGEIGDYFEWLAAGRIDLAAGGAMYTSRDTLDALFYGYDEDFLYLRFDQGHLLEHLCGREGTFEIRLSVKEMYRVVFSFADNSLKVMSGREEIAFGKGSYRDLLEIAIPLAALQLRSSEAINLSCHAISVGRESGRWPSEGNASLRYRGAALDEENWSV